LGTANARNTEYQGIGNQVILGDKKYQRKSNIREEVIPGIRNISKIRE
jgi:hypothetical protein